MSKRSPSFKHLARLGSNRAYFPKLGSTKTGLENRKPRYPELITYVANDAMKEQSSDLLGSFGDRGFEAKGTVGVMDWSSRLDRACDNASLLRLPLPMALTPEQGSNQGNQIDPFEIKDGMALALAGDESKANESRVKDRYLMNEIQVETRKQIYGLKRRSSSHQRVKQKIRSYSVHGKREYSLLSPLEQMLAVVIWRSGLAVSLNMARQSVRHGHVYVRFPEQEAFQCKTPWIRRKPGTRVELHPSYHRYALGRRQERSGLHLGEEHRRLPQYRQVDWKKGRIVFIELPKDGEVPVHVTANRSLIPRMK